MKKSFFLLMAATALFGISSNASTIELNGSQLDLTLDNASGETYTLTRSVGRHGEESALTTFDANATYSDTPSGNAYDYYYHIRNANGQQVGLLSLELNLFGPNMILYRPTDSMSVLADELNAIADNMWYAQFSMNRYAFYFHPGDYTEAGQLNTAYYISFGGLGQLPYDVSLYNVWSLCPLSDNNVTCSFWRSIENFMVPKTDSEILWWAVSQAAPMRRIVSERQVSYDFGGSASGGFSADCYFYEGASGWSQQQWYTRNCYMQVGAGSAGIPGWNHAYQGIDFGSESAKATCSDNWQKNPQWGACSREELTPVVREKPFLYVDNDGRYKVFRPALRTNSTGISYSTTDMGEGTSYDLLNDFYIARPGVSASVLNAQLAAGKHLFFTPGVYELESPLRVDRANAIVMGTGYATLVPAQANTTAAMIVGDADGICVASLLFETYYSSTYLMQVGTAKSQNRHEDNPIVLSDLVFRVGGVKGNNVNADIALEINVNDVIGDHFWIWRADHGSGVGWRKNTSKNGLVVNGDHVTCYGLFNEHFQEYQTLWNGEYGRTYFYQCETPYDVTNQTAYMSHDGTVKGYAAYKVADNVKHHYASMMGMYDVFIRCGARPIVIENAIEVPKTEDVWIHHACNYGLSGNGKGGFNYVINGSTPSTINGQYHRYQVVNYCVTGVQEIQANPDLQISVYPNPAGNYLMADTQQQAEGKVLVCDLAGRRVAQGQTDRSIDISTLQSGTYIVVVEVDGMKYSTKVIKK
ncbi:MAG: T9SS type A sorting domain-containing protein [Paludibacteraceae bacterium]|nr:T9SS type A sorting domain-containing protein [Paludibacteraceae bacterium]